MPGKHSIAVPSKLVGRYPGHALGAFAKSISLHKTAMFNTHALNQGLKGVRSPMEEV